MIQASNVWVAAAALLALQIGAFTWRIGREIHVAEKLGDINWLPWADRMNMAAMVSLVWRCSFFHYLPAALLGQKERSYFP